MVIGAIKRIVPFCLTLMMGIALGYLPREPEPREDSSQKSASFSNTSQVKCDCSRVPFRPSDNARGTYLLTNPQPQTTRAARRNRTTGIVRLCVVFGADGKARVTEVLNGVPDGLTEEAIKAVEAIRFAPAWLDGESVDEVREMFYAFD